MKGLFPCVLLLVALATALHAQDFSRELDIEKRLHEIFGTKSVVRETTFGGRLTLIDVADRMVVLYEQQKLFNELTRLGTREAARVLASLLYDERYIYEPGDDYGSYTIAQYAEDALSTIQRKHPESVPGAPSPPDPRDGKAWRRWMESINHSPLNAWRKWWSSNKAKYEQKPFTPP